jgi:hypothetical protein
VEMMKGKLKMKCVFIDAIYQILAKNRFHSFNVISQETTPEREYRSRNKTLKEKFSRKNFFFPFVTQYIDDPDKLTEKKTQKGRRTQHREIIEDIL